jgi:hypothetical protein
MKNRTNKKYHSVKIVPISNRKIVEIQREYIYPYHTFT